VLIFPEGTDLHPGGIEKSNQFAKQQGLPEYKHVLHPRATGLVALVDHLGPNLHEIIDLTMGYEDYDPAGERPSEKSFFAGRVTRKLNVLIEVFRFSKLPGLSKKGDHPCFYLEPFTGQTRGDAVRSWVTEQFKTKEAQLAQYYSLPRDAKDPLRFCWNDVAFSMKLAVDDDSAMTGERGIVTVRDPPGGAFKRTVGVPALWAYAAFLLFWGLATSNFDRLLIFGAAVFYAIETKLYGGIDKWIIFPTALRLDAALNQLQQQQQQRTPRVAAVTPATPSKEQKQS